MSDPRTPAEQITDLLRQLATEVRTEAEIIRYRAVRRGHRDVAIPDFVIHRTRRPGLLTQARAAAVPGGSAGWDDDGALSPIPSSGSFESCEPVTEAFHVPDAVQAVYGEIYDEARAAGHKTPIDAALADEDLGRQFAARLRAAVDHARIILGYDAPKIPLRDVYCPICGGPMLVRADASSAVWCDGRIPIAGPAREDEPWPIGRARCGARWPRGHWVRLLEEATRAAS